MKEFRPVIRFAAASDTHIRDDTNTGAERIGKILRCAYEAADSDKHYDKLDAVIFAGDITDAGRASQYNTFYSAVKSSLRENTALLNIVAKSHDCNEMGKAALGFYKNLTGLDTDFDRVINGYHFIGISTCSEEGVYYNEAQREFLKKSLENASRENPERPVFVFHHEHVKHTVYGSSEFDGWGNDHFSDILFQYPQIIDFSGHSHYPLNDPRSIWQGEITALGTGACFYAEFTFDGERKIRPEGCREIAQFWLVEADENNSVRLRGIDALSGKTLTEYLIDDPCDRGSRRFTPAMQESRAKAPYFDEKAKPALETVDGKIRVNVPPAHSADGEIIFAYRLTAFDKSGKAIENIKLINRYWLIEENKQIVFTLESADFYEITVTAENAYGHKSKPLKIIG